MSFAAFGSPFTIRAKKFDIQRVKDLNLIVSSIKDFVSYESKAPKDLEELQSYAKDKNNNGYYYSKELNITDPKTNKPYEYNLKGNEYELCGNFSYAIDKDDKGSRDIYYYDRGKFSEHGEGRVCVTEKMSIKPRYDDNIYPPTYPPVSGSGSSGNLNLGDQFARARNAQRSSNVNAILNSIGQNMADNNGIWICSNGTLPTKPTIMDPDNYDIAECIIPTYISVMPVDPTSGEYTSIKDYYSDYSVMRDATTGRVTVSAPYAELGVPISVTR